MEIFTDFIRAGADCHLEEDDEDISGMSACDDTADQADGNVCGMEAIPVPTT